MARGYSLHVGVNRTSRSRYPDGRYPTLLGCDNAAKALAEVFRKRRFDVGRILVEPEQVSIDSVTGALSSVCRAAQAGDMVVVTFAGHGDRVKDSDYDEPMDQAMVLHDSLFIDDEIYRILQRFRKGVRVVLVADCCYGGSIISYVNAFRTASSGEAPPRRADRGPAWLRPNVDADVILLSACKDTSRTEAARQGGGMPPFTKRLVKVLNERDYFPGGYEDLKHEIGGDAQLLPLVNDEAFLAQQPFSI